MSKLFTRNLGAVGQHISLTREGKGACVCTNVLCGGVQASLWFEGFCQYNGINTQACNEEGIPHMPSQSTSCQTEQPTKLPSSKTIDGNSGNLAQARRICQAEVINKTIRIKPTPELNVYAAFPEREALTSCTFFSCLSQNTQQWLAS